MPVNLLALLKLDMPEVRTPKPKTFTGIMIQNKQERKVKKPIGNISSIKPIGFIPEITTEKAQTLSCVGNVNNPLIPEPVNPSIPNHCVMNIPVRVTPSSGLVIGMNWAILCLRS